jgi:acetyl esterase
LYIHFHGGGGYAGKAEYEIPLLSKLASENRIACVSVSYRLAPEFEYPAGHNDAKAAIEYFLDNSEKHGYDSNKISIGGPSAGGWITMGTSILLSRERENLKNLDKIKLMILTQPMLGSAVNNERPFEQLHSWEQKIWLVTQKSGAPFKNMLSKDFETDRSDPVFVPFDLSIEEMKNLPKCVLATSEFDFINNDVHRIIPKMKEAGIYLDHLDYASTHHGFNYSPNEP